MNLPQQTEGCLDAQCPGRVLRLLVVEDHADLRAALGAFFEVLGHRARFVGDVASALRAADEEPFDVLLSDIGLPDGDGWSLLRQLEEAGRRPPLAIAMSGFGLDECVMRSKEAGFALHLTKPFAPENLIKALDTVPPVELPPLDSSIKHQIRLEKLALSARIAAA